MTLERARNALLTNFIEDVWNSGDIDAADRYIATAYTIHHDPGDPWEKQTLDLQGFKDRVRISRAPFPDQRFTLESITAEENRVAITWQWVATHQGDIPGFPATGQLIRMSGATVYFIENDRFTGHWQIADRLSVFMQLRAAAAGSTP